MVIEFKMSLFSYIRMFDRKWEELIIYIVNSLFGG